jgi:hypothetical protein
VKLFNSSLKLLNFGIGLGHGLFAKLFLSMLDFVDLRGDTARANLSRHAHI